MNTNINKHCSGNQDKMPIGEHVKIKLTKGNNYILKETDILSFQHVTNVALTPAEVEITPFLLPEGTLENIDEVNQEDALYSFCIALTKLLHRLVDLTGCEYTADEKAILERAPLGEVSTNEMNQVIKILMPMIVARLNVLNHWSPRKTDSLVITKIGEAITLSQPWVLPFSHPSITVDIDYYSSHTAKIREDGMVTYVSVIEPDGKEIFTANNHKEVLSDGCVQYPFVHGIPVFSESTNWFCIKP